jgi:photosystem II stability/assembly factor-like uncharacterized protein
MKSMPVIVYVGTRKGAFLYRGDASRRQWKVDGPHFLGQVINHIVPDPRNPKVILAAAKPGHLGPSLFRSLDGGKTWKEASKPPAFPHGHEDSVKQVFCLSAGLPSRPGEWWAGTAPHGIFRSSDNGDTWESLKGFNEHPLRPKWRGDREQGPPDDPNTHSLVLDPRDANHLYAGFSSGGVFESTDGGADWKPLNKGVAADFLPVKDAEYGHDPHCVKIHPLMPDRLYQQNHCGIYRIDRPSNTWERIGRNMPKEIGDIGFPIVLHPRDPDTAWVFPMDGTMVWPRTSPGGKPAVYVTHNAGKTWKRQDKGLPKSQAWLTVKRQAFTCDAATPVGLYFGTTSGELWASRDEGAKWECIASHLPHICSIETRSSG